MDGRGMQTVTILTAVCTVYMQSGQVFLLFRPKKKDGGAENVPAFVPGICQQVFLSGLEPVLKIHLNESIF